MSDSLRRRDLLLGIGAATATAAVGIGGITAADSVSAASGSDDDEPARLRVAHAAPDAPNVDVFVDGGRLLSDVNFRSVSDYLTIQAGSYPVKITPAGDPDTLAFEGEVTLEAGTDYTMAAIGELTEETFRAELLVDKNRELPDMVAEVRVVHASPDAPAVDVVTDHGRTVAENISFGHVGHYRVFFAGETNLAVQPASADSDAEPVSEAELSLQGGKTYTLFAEGYLTPDDEPTDESFGLVPAVGGPRPETARIRGIHAVPDAPNVDVFVDGEKEFSKVHFGDVTDYLSLSAGTYEVAVTAAGDPDTVAFEGEVPLEAGTDYSVAAIGELSEGTVSPALLVDQADVDAGQAGVRVLHASPDAPAVDVTANDAETTLADGLSFGNSTDLLNIDSGSYTIEVRPDSRTNDNPFDAEFDVELAPDRLYTVVATGYFTADDEPSKNQFMLIPAVTDLTE